MIHALLLLPLLQFPESATESRPANDPKKIESVVTSVPRIEWNYSKYQLSRAAKPNTYFDAIGRQAFLCGKEDGAFEAWIWPYQIFHDAKFSFRPEKSLEAFDLHKYSKKITVGAHQTTIHYQSADIFVDCTIDCSSGELSICILLNIDIDVPGTLVFSFVPKLQPQWPAARGGVAARWAPELGAFVISEPSASVAAVVGSPWAGRATEGIQYLLPDGSLKIEIPLTPERCKKETLPFVVSFSDWQALSEAKRSYIDAIQMLPDYAKARPLYPNAPEIREKRVDAITKIETPDTELNSAFLWNSISLLQGVVSSGGQGTGRSPKNLTGLVAGYGPAGATSQRPGFAWFFTGDVGVNAIAYLHSGLAKELAIGLRLAASYQRGDGKIPHEVVLSAGLCNWFDKYPFAYIHGETTALWLHAVRQYYDFTGDEKLLTDLRQNLYKAHDWLAREMEIGKGVPTNASAGMGASEIGPLRQNLYSDMYLAATAAIAMQDYAVLAEVHRNGLLQKSSEELARKAKDRIANDFWSEKLQSYAHALLIDNQLSDERTVWPAVAVMYGLVDGERATKTMEWIDSDLLTTPWGTRILSKDSKYYDPKGYNSGAVWPFVTGLAALADFQIGRADEGYKKVKAVASLTFSEALGRTPEVLSGSRPRSLDTSVPHQLFSSMAVVAPVMDGIFGYKPNAGANKILLQPCFPTGWKTAKAEKLLFGKTTFDSKIDRDADSYHVLVTWRGENPPEFDLKPKNGKPGKLQIMSAK